MRMPKACNGRVQHKKKEIQQQRTVTFFSGYVRVDDSFFFGLKIRSHRVEFFMTAHPSPPATLIVYAIVTGVHVSAPSVLTHVCIT